MKYIFIILTVFLGVQLKAQVYNPANFNIQNNAMGFSQKSPSDARSMYFNSTYQKFRDFASKTEVITYFTQNKYKFGGAPIYIHSGGTLQNDTAWIGGRRYIYIFRDSTDINSLTFWSDVQTVNGQIGDVVVKNADSLRNLPIDTTVSGASKNNYLLTFDSTNRKWKLTAPASSYTNGTGILISGNVISADNTTALWNANSLRGRSITTGSPSVGQTLSWNGVSWIYSSLNGLDTAYTNGDTLFLVNTFDTIPVLIKTLYNADDTLQDNRIVHTEDFNLEFNGKNSNLVLATDNDDKVIAVTPAGINITYGANSDSKGIRIDNNPGTVITDAIDSVGLVGQNLSTAQILANDTAYTRVREVRQIVGDSSGNYIRNDNGASTQNGGFKLGTGSKIEVDTLKIGYTSTGLSTDSVLVRGTDGLVRKVAQRISDTIPDQLIVEKILQDTTGVFNKTNAASIIEIGNDSLLNVAIVFSGATSDDGQTDLYKWYSPDNGKTWSSGTIAVAHVGTNYPQTPSLYRKGNGDILMIGLVTQGADSNWIVKWTSTDKGQTWSSYTRILLTGRWFGPMGDRLFKYGNRLYYPFSINTNGDPSTGGNHVGKLMYSDNEGTTWDTVSWRINSPDSLCIEPGIYHCFSRNGNDQLVFYWRDRSGTVYSRILSADGSILGNQINTNIKSPNATTTIKQVGNEKLWIALHSLYNPYTDTSGLAQRRFLTLSQSTNGIYFDQGNVISKDSNTIYYEPSITFIKNKWFLSTYTTANETAVVNPNPKYPLKYFIVPASRLSFNGNYGSKQNDIVYGEAETELNGGIITLENNGNGLIRNKTDRVQSTIPYVFAPDVNSNYLSGNNEKIQFFQPNAAGYNSILLNHSYQDGGGDYGNYIKFLKTNAGSFDQSGKYSGLLDFQQGTAFLGGRMNSLYYPSSTTSLVDMVFRGYNSSGVISDKFTINSEGIGYVQNKLGIGITTPDSTLQVSSLHTTAGVRHENTPISSDTTTYKPVAINTNGTIVKLPYWPVGTGGGSGGGTAMGIDSSIINATAGSVLFVGANGVLQQKNTDYFYDSTNKYLGIGSNSLTSRLHLQTNSLGESQTSSSGLSLINTTAAANNAQQISPAIRWTAQGWKTDATAGSQTTDFRMYNYPVQGSANPTSNLAIEAQVNNGGYNNIVNFNSNGNIGIGTTTPTVSYGKGINTVGANNVFRFTCTANGGWNFFEFFKNSTSKYIFGYTDGVGVFKITPSTNLDATSGFSMDGNGSIGINTNTPGAFGLNVNRSVAINKDSATRVTSLGTNVITLLDTANGGKLQSITGADLATAIGATSYTFSNGLTNTSGTVRNDLITGKSGGQIVVGGTDSGDPLYLNSNPSNNGKIFLGSAGLSAYDELNGRLGIGQSSPSAVLHLKAGTATANTAPLKFTSGTNLTTPEVGVFEYDGSNFYQTNSTTTRGVLEKTRTNVSSAGTLNITSVYSDFIFSGTTTTWTLPALTGNTNVKIFIKNRGSGNITLNSNAGANDIYSTSAVNTYTILPGEAIILVCDGTYFNVM